MNDNEIIAEYKKYEPFFGSWYIRRFVGEGSFAKVFEIVRNDFGNEYVSALKIITVAKNKTEIEAMQAEGMSERDIRENLRGIVEDTIREIQLMYKLKGNGNIVGYEDHAVVEHEDGMGWDILIKMEYLTSLGGYIRQHKGKIAKQEVVKLGIDICKALEACQKYNIIHRDIKADNVFASENGEFKLGDFGIARVVERKDMELSKKGTSAYMAPEIYKGNTYTSAVDIYSLGIVLYRLLNNNRMPFLPPYPKPVSLDDRDKALAMRMSGTKLPKPSQASGGRLVEIIMKACAYQPQERYSSPVAMRQELEAILHTQEETAADEMIVIYEDQEGGEQFPNTGTADQAAGRKEAEYEATEVLREEPPAPAASSPAQAYAKAPVSRETIHPAPRTEYAASPAALNAMDSSVKILCRNCGNAINRNAVFCPVCGADQKPQTAAAASGAGKKGHGRRKLLLVGGIGAALLTVVGVIIAIVVTAGSASSRGSIRPEDIKEQDFGQAQEEPDTSPSVPQEPHDNPAPPEEADGGQNPPGETLPEASENWQAEYLEPYRVQFTGYESTGWHETWVLKDNPQMAGHLLYLDPALEEAGELQIRWTGPLMDGGYRIEGEGVATLYGPTEDSQDYRIRIFALDGMSAGTLKVMDLSSIFEMLDAAPGNSAVVRDEEDGYEIVYTIDAEWDSDYSGYLYMIQDNAQGRIYFIEYLMSSAVYDGEAGLEVVLDMLPVNFADYGIDVGNGY